MLPVRTPARRPSWVRHGSFWVRPHPVIDPSAPRHGPSSIHPRPVTVRHRSIRAPSRSVIDP
ncbi:MAG: hypothetical protein KDJ70_10675, partial [Candidatus Competibacteraceae bacterium]|nr:hypothetical protein [Candidatus Competibacteraceae bacterium]